jgi:hypothetical protein
MYWIFTLIFLMPILYFVVAGRDAACDIKEVFDMRIVRRATRRKQISILGMLVITIIAALFFAYVRDWNVPVSRWPLLLLMITFAAGMAKLAQIAFQDATAKGVRRQYRQLYDRQAESAQADFSESDTMAPNAHVQGAENETGAD